MSAHVSYRCQWCYDRGKYFIVGDGKQGRTFGPCFIKCLHCTQDWTQQTRTIDKEYREAIKWLATSVPPEKPFRLSRFKTVENPAIFWEELKKDIAMDNVYVLERRRDDVIALNALFGGEDF